jgi:dTDP-4-amino-4,6-dideoxygalactose transaminase
LLKPMVDHGRKEKYKFDFFSGNFRMDGLQAAVLTVKLSGLAQWTERRRELAKMYDERLVPKGFRVLKPRPQAQPVYHLYVVEVANREEVQSALKAKGIETISHYPLALSEQPAFKVYGYAPGSLPVSERMASRVLSLPFFPEMTVEQMDYVTREFLAVARA